jgi:hypothetical protein
MQNNLEKKKIKAGGLKLQNIKIIVKAILTKIV